MLNYQYAGYRPAGIRLSRTELGQPLPTATKAAISVSSLVAAGLGAGTVYVGIRSGERERGARKVISYAVAVFGAFVALSGLGALGIALAPSITGDAAKA